MLTRPTGGKGKTEGGESLVQGLEVWQPSCALRAVCAEGAYVAMGRSRFDRRMTIVSAVSRHRKCVGALGGLQTKDGHEMKRRASISHEDAMVRELRDNPEFAAEYLKAAMAEADEPKVLLIALRQIAKARGVAKVARAAHIERESLYRALSPRGNPRLTTLMAVTKALGLTLTVEPSLTQRSRNQRG
jgi:probable addiction module antidote protein